MMLPIKFGPHDLLEYNTRHGVLICRECQYAIQKSALRSHLLRHKIYRDERQHLLSSIAQLELFEPHHVPLPSPASPPIATLPLISGYRCTLVGCGNLCASYKRMRRHWSEVHGLIEPLNSSSFFREVTLQTFFRGTKLRYFEVNPSSTADEVVVNPNDDETYGELDKAKISPRQRVPPLLKTTLKSSPVDLNLNTLAYFHHFITTTSLTLPSAQHSQSTVHYWQKDIVLQALQRRWLMFGILAISACHLAMFTDDATDQQVHGNRSIEFFSEFSVGYDEAVQMEFVEVEEEARRAGVQLRCLLRCGHWALAKFASERESISEIATPQLQSIMTTLRDFVVLDFGLPLGGNDDSQKEMFSQARKILKASSSPDAEGSSTFSSYNDTRSAVLNRLDKLPFRMAEAFGRPESTQDVLVTLSAIAALVECCDSSFASDEAGAKWRAMAKWLTKIPGHFEYMVSQQNPAALVVVAHWAASLVRRAEYCGYWFLKGLSKRILLLTAERLPVEEGSFQTLIENLVV